MIWNCKTLYGKNVVGLGRVNSWDLAGAQKTKKYTKAWTGIFPLEQNKFVEWQRTYVIHIIAKNSINDNTLLYISKFVALHKKSLLTSLNIL